MQTSREESMSIAVKPEGHAEMELYRDVTQKLESVFVWQMQNAIILRSCLRLLKSSMLRTEKVK